MRMMQILHHFLKITLELPYSGKPSRKKTFAFFAVPAIRESFLREILWAELQIWGIAE